MKEVYNILEVANTHEGNQSNMEKIIDEFSDFNNNFGIKFQPFHYDRIALPDFRAYELYKSLYFSSVQWKNYINESAKTKDVWLDIFDDYSCEILNENIDAVAGLKFQPSIVYNRNVIQLLSQQNLERKKIMINISGIDPMEISILLERFKEKLHPESIILQVGFQAYPTEPADAGLHKIPFLREKYRSYDIGFADHSAPDSGYARFLPVQAVALGAVYIEKHIRVTGHKPKYDYQSSMDKNEYRDYLEKLNDFRKAVSSPFINEKERNYLKKTMQVPVLKINKRPGTLIDMENDLDFRRTNQPGLSMDELEKLIQDYYILGQGKKAGETLQKTDLKKANIAVIIGCRLKSSRLPRKAVLKIGDLSSVELCIKSSLRFKNINHTILATSWLEEDAELEHYLYSDQVIFEKGHPDDVLDRYVQIVNKYKIDVVVRATADMPYLSSEIFEYLLDSHFKKGADYTKANKMAVGTTGSITNGEAFIRAKRYFPDAEYSEYLTYYFLNNPAHFKLNKVDLPPEYIRDYRLTVDYQEDLDVFNLIAAHLKAENLEPTIQNIFMFLDNNPDVVGLNKNMTLVYEVDQELIKKIREHSTIKEPPESD